MALTFNYRGADAGGPAGEFQTNTDEPGNQLMPDVLGLSNGGFVAAYNSSVGSTGTIQLDFYDAGFNHLTLQAPAEGTTLAAGQPSLTQLANGNVLVVWDENIGDPNTGGPRGRLYSPTGTPIGGELFVTEFGGSGSSVFNDPHVVALAGGGFVISYNFFDDVHIRRFNDAGVRQGDIIIGNTATATANDSSVAALADGGFVATWTSGVGAGENIRGAIYNADGSVRRADFAIDDLAGSSQRQSEVAALPNGNFAVIYTDNSWGDEATGITLQIRTPTGNLVTFTRTNFPTETAAESDPDITVLANGFILVSWTSPSGGDGDIAGRIFNQDGSPVSLNENAFEFFFTQSATNDILSAVASLTGGRIISSWQDSFTDGDGGSIRSITAAIVRDTFSNSAADSFAGDQLQDVFTGNAGDDLFVYAPGGNADVWTDFVAGAGTEDKIVLSGFSTVRTLGDVLARATQVGADTVINFGNGDTLTLRNVTKSNLSGDDFLGLVPSRWQKSPAELADFGWAQGWTSPDYVRQLEDIDNDGSVDYAGYGASRMVLGLGGTWDNGAGVGSGFRQPTFGLINDFTPAQGYDASYVRGFDELGNFGSSGAEAWGQGNGGIVYYRATGGETVVDAAGDAHLVPQYEGPHVYAEFGRNQGWDSHFNFDNVILAGDSFASILGFGVGGLVVGPQAYAPGASAGQVYFGAGTAGIGNASGWDSELDIRTFKDEFGNTIDLNGDSIADFVGMGPNGLQYAFGFEDGGGNFQLDALQTAHVNGAGADFGRAQGWTNEGTPRFIADLNGDGRQDIVGFGGAGAVVSLGQDPATNGGEAFGQAYLGIADFGLAQGWNSVDAFPRVLGDVNGDGVIDIVGFGNSATVTALGSQDAFGKVTWAIDPALSINDYGVIHGWNDGITIRQLADVDDDGKAELVLSGAFGTQTWDLV